jgi:hypothetical protein
MPLGRLPEAILRGEAQAWAGNHTMHNQRTNRWQRQSLLVTRMSKDSEEVSVVGEAYTLMP